MVIQRLGSNLRVDLSEPPQRKTFIRCQLASQCLGLGTKEVWIRQVAN